MHGLRHREAACGHAPLPGERTVDRPATEDARFEPHPPQQSDVKRTRPIRRSCYRGVISGWLRCHGIEDALAWRSDTCGQVILVSNAAGESSRLAGLATAAIAAEPSDVTQARLAPIPASLFARPAR